MESACFPACMKSMKSINQLKAVVPSPHSALPPTVLFPPTLPSVLQVRAEPGDARGQGRLLGVYIAAGLRR